MTLARSFPPIAALGARVLVLGSMPGAASLAAVEYYAHPRNAFWPIMGELFGAGPELPYEARAARLREHGVAVWDVLRECRRAGSLDASIVVASERANDFPAFLARFDQVERIYFNGQKAEAAFRRHAAPRLPDDCLDRLTLTRLPSTSPAHAGMSFAEKLANWRQVSDHAGKPVNQ
ncbi:Uracil DNA glycosylase superfamily protein [Posidoniimonas polymericola]|uniref:Uracil DNA glycosylase superfamily protein n=1 Tax=Posidoniimonas polymericola TaxID=2528002 RepID=A0A5C5ZET2_9BACT|nr:DNA-deoxyinosine glycosylase [Posidoniimonas polymericola]TWT85557.1 Uracil DNA glycosylase superfamily protein [Posidoniimonas polymericola]